MSICFGFEESKTNDSSCEFGVLINLNADDIFKNRKLKKSEKLKQ